MTMRAEMFSDDSMLRRVNRERSVAFSGGRALLMQAAHPLAFAGFYAHTDALAEPYKRLERTAQVMHTIYWGSREDAERLTRRVRSMHSKARGTLEEAAGPFPAGTPYAADDPALLLWVLATLVDSALVVYSKYVRPLTRAERATYWREYKEVGHLFGLTDADMPDTLADFESYVDEMVNGEQLYVTPQARELSIQIVLRPPAPLWARGLVEAINQTTIGLLPVPIRRQYGFSWDPARAVALHGGAEYLRRVVLPLMPEKLRYLPTGAR
ncbi:MAG: hypothetical protein AVDCRST_MAG65-939 [uncultured Solirubrobacteraceae bacterium]|uniref:ER-bound oxygenase mpaB/mpaB'/Rubber oxygenase catalytic domain-containing protein n=1 Tax=uncultured Solirubrobacteraceae bacterium TaxID=1162706 RepID=A0A6J4RNF0_9ACTN|nr:MAG: hypothetical protein AVDCRST_MAG65-939 [uncultured Solirubrobacteraceae bacterium]